LRDVQIRNSAAVRDYSRATDERTRFVVRHAHADRSPAPAYP
jgi:hypothetical protein